MKPLPLALALAALGAAAFLPGTSGADPPGSCPSDLFLEWLAGWESGSWAGSSGMRIGFDPETGEWGHPTPGQALALGGVPHTAGPARVIRMPDGSTVSILDESAMEYLVARIGPDGRLVLGCGGREALPGLLRLSPEGGQAAPER